METSGTTSWTGSSGTTLSKVTTAANVHMGTQSLRLQADSANDYAESASIHVVPGETYYVAMIARADTGTVLLVVNDATNSAEIDSSGRVSHSLEKFMHVWRTFTVPATCEDVTIRLQLSGASDDGYFDRVIGPYPVSGRGRIAAPSWMLANDRLNKLMTASYARTYSGNVDDADSRVFSAPWQPGIDYAGRFIPQDANPNQIEFRRRSIPQADIWFEGTRPAADFTTWAYTSAGETSPTSGLPKRLLAMRWLEEICEHVLQREEKSLHAEAERTLRELRSRTSANSLTLALEQYKRDLVTPRERRRAAAGWTSIGSGR